MASKNKETLLKEIRDAANRFEKGSTKRTLLDNMYTKIKEFDNDEDIINTMWANKELPLRMLTEYELSKMPTFSNLISGEPYTGKIDYEKSFGEDWYKNYENIPYNQIALAAKKAGKDPKEAVREMSAEATKLRRDDVAHGRWDPNDPWYKNAAAFAGGIALDLFGQRQQEAIARGEDPSWQDYGLDIGQSALEAVPYGRIMRIVSGIAGPSKLARVLSYLGQNATAPVVTEVADANLYDDSNPRGRFNKYEALAGIGTNIVGDALLRSGGAVVKRVSDSDIGSKIGQLGEGPSFTESLARDIKNIDDKIALDEMLMIRNKAGKGVGTKATGSLAQRAEVLANERNLDKLKYQKQVLEEIDYRYNKNRARTLLYGDNNPSLPKDIRIPPTPESLRNLNRPRTSLTDNQIKALNSDPNLSMYLRSDVTPGVTDRQLFEDAAFRTLLTNKYGSVENEQGRALTRLPFHIGQILQKQKDKDDKEEARRKAEEDIYNQYKLDLLGGR